MLCSSRKCPGLRSWQVLCSSGYSYVSCHQGQSFLKVADNIRLSWPDPALLWSCRAIWDVEVGHDPTACAHLIASMRGRKQSQVTGRTPLSKNSAPGDSLRSYTLYIHVTILCTKSMFSDIKRDYFSRQ
jgi:hypothetical protein